MELLKAMGLVGLTWLLIVMFWAMAAEAETYQVNGKRISVRGAVALMRKAKNKKYLIERCEAVELKPVFLLKK